MGGLAGKGVRWRRAYTVGGRGRGSGSAVAVRVRERREVANHRESTLDNDGIQHLNDELDAVGNGTWTHLDGDGETRGGGFDEADATGGQSGPRWRPLLGSNQRPSAWKFARDFIDLC